MLQMMLLSVALSWDSFVVGLFDGGFALSRSSRRSLPILFGVCDGLAVVIGLFAQRSPIAGLAQISAGWWFVPWLLLVFVVVRRLMRARSAELKWMIAFVPILLSLDNLLAAPAFAHVGVPPVLCVLAAALTSTGLCLAGRFLGEGARSRVRWLDQFVG